MRRFAPVESVVTPLDRANVDTDQIIPKQFLKLVRRSGFGAHLFHGWRFTEAGDPDPGFVLNDPRYAGSRILAAGENFGCGSSREHAVWALSDYGFDVIVAPSFADIFYGNCFKNGVLPVALPAADLRAVTGAAGPVRVDLRGRAIAVPGRAPVRFGIEPHRRRALLEGLDDIALTLEHEGAISSFEGRSGIPPVS